MPAKGMDNGQTSGYHRPMTPDNASSITPTACCRVEQMTPDSPEFDPRLSKDRWVACFDLLGIRSKLVGGNPLQVFFDYTDALKEAKRNRLDQVSFFWFSDTFVFYTGQTSKSDFVWLEYKARMFCHFLVLKQIPVRGAIS
jgi:hypothetical protein